MSVSDFLDFQFYNLELLCFRLLVKIISNLVDNLTYWPYFNNYYLTTKRVNSYLYTKHNLLYILWFYVALWKQNKRFNEEKQIKYNKLKWKFTNWDNPNL